MPILSYPPTHIKTTDGVVNVLQLTDLHLYLDINKEVAGVNNYQSFLACLNQALSEEIRCDLILITGDLVNEVKPEIYDHIFDILSDTGIPFACIAGNHDVTDELGAELPFDQRTFEAHQPDQRLLSQHCIMANDWKLLLIDSSVSGAIYGRVDNTTLQWLRQSAQISHNPVIITMHHHVLPMNSAWIDEHITQDAGEFWDLVETTDAIKAIVSGHVHQQYEGKRQGVQVLTTPSTCYQFKPNHDDFAFDEQAQPGYRWLSLQDNGVIDSWVERLITKTNEAPE